MQPDPTEITRLKPCRHGRMVFLRTDQFIGASLDLYGEYCEAEAEIFGQIVAPGQIVVEAGANIGAHTVPLAKLVGDRGAVFAFEPQPTIFQLLCANVALNEAFHVRTVHAACGSTAGRLKVPPIDYHVSGSNFGGVSLLHGATGSDVDVIALDSLELPSLRLLKIDVEGMELAVIEGAKRHIARHRPVIYVENDRRDASGALIASLQAQGYDLWWHLAPLFRSENHAGVAHNIFGGVTSINMLCLPREQPNAVTGFRLVTGPDAWWNDPLP